MDDLVSDFVCEAAESLGGLQAGLSALALDRVNTVAAAEMLRRLHGLKGICGLVGFSRSEALVHAGESLLATFVAGHASSAALAPLSRMIERLSVLFAAAAARGSEPEGDDADLIGALEGLSAQLRTAPSEAAAVVAVSALAHVDHGALSTAERRTRAPWAGLDTLARALGDRLGKRIELMVGGDDVRIASAAAPALRTALIALVRNACDHGVEAPAERRAVAKPALSLLRLSVHRSAGGATIELADDGRGVDPDRVRAHCIASGRLDKAGADALGEAEAQTLIFSPGVTTAGVVTSLSGRGLGLELVRAELDAIGGAVALASVPGKGACFVLTLPASALASPAARRRVAA